MRGRRVCLEVEREVGGEALGERRRLGRVGVSQFDEAGLHLVRRDAGRWPRGGERGRFGVLRIIHARIIPATTDRNAALFPIRDLNPTRITPIATIGLIIVSIAAYSLWQPRGSGAEGFAYENAAIACELTTGQPLTAQEITTRVCRDDGAGAVFPEKNIWLAAVASMFLHGGVFHIFGNMWFLWVFGNNVEEAFGALGFLAFYLVTGLLATAAFVAFNPEETIPLLGASGAIAGVLGSYLVLYPTHRVLSLFIFFFVPIPAILFLGIWFLSQFGIESEGVAWQAHVGGFIAGVLLTLPLRPMLLGRVARLHQPRTTFLSR